MNMTENSRLMIGLREKGWSDTEIVNFCLWVETGDEKYRPKEDAKIKGNADSINVCD